MSRTPYRGPKLPGVLLDQVGIPGNKKRVDSSRKDHRKAQQTRKSAATTRAGPAQRRAHDYDDRDSDERPVKRLKQDVSRPPIRRPTATSKPPKSILKRPVAAAAPPPPPAEDFEDFGSEDESEEEELVTKPVVSRAVQRKLDEDDAEIAALEKKLGIRGKKSKAVDKDGLDFLAEGSDASDEADTGFVRRKSAEDEDWLKAKRRKATTLQDEVESESEEDEESQDGEGDHEEMDSDMEGLQNPFSDDELSSDDFDDLDSDEPADVPPVKKKRENPYVAPTTKATGKYVPPSLRRQNLGQDEDLTQLKRQVQGQLNRLSEANFVSILTAIEDIYNNNARGHVTSSLIDLFMGLIATPSTLSETFLILHSAFATALYKVIGADFGAQLLEKITQAITTFSQDQGKQVLNLIGFLSNLYIMQMTGPAIVFDYIRGLLDDLSENNTELLLRIVRTAGTQLRQDDPSSLKDIVLLLTRSVSKTGESNLSVRTKFMVETINDLKNNKMKTGINASAITSEHVVRMKKTLGSLNTRTLRASEPLQITLADIQNSDKKGKWWLVGASYHDPAKLADQHPALKSSTRTTHIDDGYESETPGHVSLPKLAKAQGMNTDIRRAVFIAIMSASDFQDAHQRIMKLQLKSKQVLEVAKVLLHCVGAEKVYNPYYTVLARKLCADAKIQKAVLSSLWDTLRKVTNDMDNEPLSTTAIVNMARLYGTLVVEDQITIVALKTLDFATMPEQAQIFAEMLLTTVMTRAAKSKTFEESVQAVFSQVSAAPRMLPGLQLFLQQVVSMAELTSTAKERRAVQRGCEIAKEELLSVASGAGVESSDSDSFSD